MTINTKNKANGRVESANKKEVASATVRTFICDKCGKMERTNEVEFGKVFKCSCGGIMVEE